MAWSHALVLLAAIGVSAAQFRAFPGGRKASEDFDCPEDFGYYPHPVDCSKYYVCVFGGALEEVCSNGLVYSQDLLTCDWPRNVEACAAGVDQPRKATSAESVARGTARGAASARAPVASAARARQAAPDAAAARPRPRQPVSRPATPVRNNLDERTAGSFGRLSSSSRRPSSSSTGRFDIDEQVRLLDNLDRRPTDLDVRFEGDTNKIVTRRQQRLFSPDSSSGRGRFQQSLQDEQRVKATAAPPIRISTLSSFSFGDTGTRFPEREPAPSPAPTFAARPPPSTFVSSSRAPPPPRPSPSPFPATVTVQTVNTGRPSVPPPTPASPSIQTYTEPAYVAYVNDTIYDVYYIYDDEEVLYEDDFATDAPARRPATTTTTTVRNDFTQPTQSPPRQRRPTVAPARQTAGGRQSASTARTPSNTATRQGVRSSFSSTGSFRKTPATDLTSTRGSTLGSTFRQSSTRGSTSQSSFGPSSSTFGSTSTGFTSTRGSSTRGSSTLSSTRGSSTLSSSRGTSTLSSTRGSSTTGSSRGSSRGSAPTQRTASQSRVKSSGFGSSSSVRRPTNGLRSIDTGSSRQPASRKKTQNSVRGQSRPSKVVNIWEHPPWRPAPVYPTPIPDDPAERCDARCKLPDCYCGGSATPGGFETQDTPQLVLLTFDDSVNDLNKGLYKDMFENGRVNPNGCPIASTMYVSHEWTDYRQVQNLYADGHEIASHSISHSFGEQFSTSKWEKEIAGQREILAAYGGVRLDDIRGMRAPFLSIGGNRMFKMLYNNNFTYDSSMPVYENNPPSWPYTLDYKIHHDCMIPPCPNKAYPGVWEVPMVMWQDLSGGRCSMVDACSAPSTAEEVYKMLIKNFQRHYTTNRAVFPLYFHAAWFTTEHHKEGFMAFLDTISKMDDVWLVTNWQAIQWMRDPQPLSTVKNFKPFGCDYPERPGRCTKARKCSLWHKSGMRYMTTCQPCPEKYPWTGKTGVSRP